MKPLSKQLFLLFLHEHSGSTGVVSPSLCLSSAVMAAVTLDRPQGAAVAFDYKTGKCAIGCPLEHIKSGTLRGLVTYGAFYALRARRPELCGSAGARLGLDEDFVSIFWLMLPSFTSVEAVASEVGALLDGGGALAALQAAEFVAAGVEPVASAPPGGAPASLYRHAPAVRERVLDLAEAVSERLASYGADAGSALEPLLDEASVRLRDAVRLGRAVSAASRSALALGQPIPAGAGAGCATWEPGALLASPGLRALPRTVLPRAGGSLPVDTAAVFPSLWHAPYDVLAAQLCYIEHGLLRGVPLSEWLACGWDNPRYLHTADAIRRYIDRFNGVALWVTAEVLAPDSSEERAAAIVRFIKLGVMLRAFHNYTALAELSTGLRRDSIKRLTRTWARVPPAAVSHFEALVALVEDKRNYYNYKAAVRALPRGVPHVVHLGPHTAELTMQEMLLTPEVEGPDGGAAKFLHFRRLRELTKLTLPLLAAQDAGYEAAHAAAAVGDDGDDELVDESDVDDEVAGTRASSSVSPEAAAALRDERARALELRRTLSASAPALLRMPPHSPGLCNMLEAAVRPFCFASEDARAITVKHLERRSRALELPPEEEPSYIAAQQAAAAEQAANAAAAAEAERKARGTLFSRLWSPSRKDRGDRGGGGGGGSGNGGVGGDDAGTGGGDDSEGENDAPPGSGTG